MTLQTKLRSSSELSWALKGKTGYLDQMIFIAFVFAVGKSIEQLIVLLSQSPGIVSLARSPGNVS